MQSLNIRDRVLGPFNGVQVESGGRIEPQVDALLTAADTMGEHIRLKDVWLSA